MPKKKIKKFPLLRSAFPLMQNRDDMDVSYCARKNDASTPINDFAV